VIMPLPAHLAERTTVSQPDGAPAAQADGGAVVQLRDALQQRPCNLEARRWGGCPAVLTLLPIALPCAPAARRPPPLTQPTRRRPARRRARPPITAPRWSCPRCGPPAGCVLCVSRRAGSGRCSRARRSMPPPSGRAPRHARTRPRCGVPRAGHASSRGAGCAAPQLLSVRRCAVARTAPRMHDGREVCVESTRRRRL
jgi:hypothetical protein